MRERRPQPQPALGARRDKEGGREGWREGQARHAKEGEGGRMAHSEIFVVARSEPKFLVTQQIAHSAVESIR
jgi:hypothetical protein